MFPQVPLTRKPTCTQAIDPWTSGSTPPPCGHLTTVPEFRAFSRLSLARLPMVGTWFTTPWRRVPQSHGAVPWRYWPPIASHVPFPFATSRHWPNARVPSFTDLMGPLYGPCHTPALAP